MGQADNFDPYLNWLGIRDPQRPPNHYRLLGLEVFENDANVIAAAADRQIAHIRTYQAGQHGESSQRILNELTAARLCLLKPERKADYDNRLRAALGIPALDAQPQWAATPPGAAPVIAMPATGGMYPLPAPQPLPMPQQFPQRGGPYYPGDVSAAPGFLPPPNQHGGPAPAAAAANWPSQPPQAMSSDQPFPQTHWHAPQIGAAAKPSLAGGVKKQSLPIVTWSILGGLLLFAVILVAVIKSQYSGDSKATVKANKKPAKPVPEISNPITPKNETSTATPKPNNIPPPEENPKQPANPSEQVPVPANPKTNPPPDEPAREKSAVPEAKAIADKRKLILDNYKRDYDEANTAARPEFAKKLLKMASESADDPPAMFALLDETRIVAASVGEVGLVSEACDELVNNFTVDASKERTASLMLFRNYPLKPEQFTHVLDFTMKSLLTAIREENVEYSEGLHKVAVSLAQRTPDKNAREKMLRELAKDVNDIKTNAPRIKALRESLEKSPDDPEVNLELGKYLCLTRGKFTVGLIYLAKGSDPALKAAAAKEIASPNDVADYANIGDEWWNATEKLPADQKLQVRIHAGVCYARALPELRGLALSQPEGRLAELQKDLEKSPQMSSEGVVEIAKLLLTRGGWRMSWAQNSWDEPVLQFQANGSVNSRDFPTWELSDSYGFICKPRTPAFPPGFPPHAAANADKLTNFMIVKVTLSRLEMTVIRDGKVVNKGEGTLVDSQRVGKGG